jgi:hypothetical protein
VEGEDGSGELGGTAGHRGDVLVGCHCLVFGISNHSIHLRRFHGTRIIVETF